MRCGDRARLKECELPLFFGAMAMRDLLRQPFRPRLLHADSTSWLGTRFAPVRTALPRKRYGATQLKEPLGSIHCLKQEPAGSDGEVLEWVNKTPRDPMVELDPVTVFRRIVAERRASISAGSASARAMDEEQANLALETGSSFPFIFRRKWPGNTGVAIAIALVLLALAAAFYMLRSRKKNYKAMEVSSADTNDTPGLSSNGRQKLVKDSIDAPESVLTAMAIGAASVSRPKGYMGATQGTLHSTNGNAPESQRPEGETDIHRTVSMVAVEDEKSDSHGKLTLEQAPNGSNIVEDSTPLKFESSGIDGIDVTEGPWFGQGVNADNNDMLAPLGPEEIEAEKPVEAESENLESFEIKDVVTGSQALPLLNDVTAAPPLFTEQLVYETSAGGGLEPETMPLSGPVDGESYGNVVSVLEQENFNSIQVLDLKVESPQVDGNLAENNTPAEKLEQAVDFTVEELQVDGNLTENSMPAEKLEHFVEEDSVKSLEAKDGTALPDQNMDSDLSASDSSGETDWESNDESDNNECHGIYLINQDGSVTSLDDAYDGKRASKKKFAEPHLHDPKSDCPSAGGGVSNPYVLSGVDQTLAQEIDTGLENGLDGLPATTSQMDHLDKLSTNNQESFDPTEHSSLGPEVNSTASDAAMQASEEEMREEGKKALETAMPALAMGVGTVGALFGVAGGLQVVGFAALANLVSHDFLWAQSRESLWQELNGITDRQKLLDFLARRNIVRTSL